jgi:hypothetical protein
LLSAAALGIRCYVDPEDGSLGYFAFWIVAALMCVLLHAFGQALVGRLFGIRCGIVLDGLGGQIVGVESLPRLWQRVSVLLAGPVVSFLLVAGIWAAIELIPFPRFLIDWGWQSPIATGALMLVRINLAWGLLSISPIWPLSGGRIAVDAGETLLGRKGRIAAMILSLVVTALLTVWIVFEMSWHLNFRYDPLYLLHLQECLIWLVFCFALWILGFKAVWSAHESNSADQHNRESI